MATEDSPQATQQRALPDLLEQAINAREPLFDPARQSALRLFNGFSEGCPQLLIDLYGRTVVFNDYSAQGVPDDPLVRQAADTVRARLPWLRAGVVKIRKSSLADERNGKLLFGEEPDLRIRENGTWYAVDLTLSRDAGFYIDTRNLRLWASRALAGKTVLNAFAYTGSLGVAAAAGGARRVVQLDRNTRYLDLARQSYLLNGLPIAEEDFMRGDFFRQAGTFRRQDRRFDCVFLDPPFFAAGPAGSVDQVNESARLINKARPLVEDGGYLVAINNALYVSGADYLATLEGLATEGYLRVEEIVPVPEDCTGYWTGDQAAWMADPAPFNHPTKIVVLKLRRK